MLSGVNKNQREMSTGHYEKAHVYAKTLKKKQKNNERALGTMREHWAL